MITFNYETAFTLKHELITRNWISQIIKEESFNEGEINYIFCDDEYLFKLNVEYLGHDTFTDIISFDYSERKNLQGDIFISIDRVNENAKDFKVGFSRELHRVMIHGILHFCGFKDKTTEEQSEMRCKEDSCLEALEELL